MSHPVITAWHRIVDSRDPSGLDALLADDAVFHSPVVHTPQRGNALTRSYLTAAMQVLTDAAKAAGSNDTMAIAEALKAKGPFKTVLGELSFDAKGDVTRPEYVMYEWKKGDDGKFTYVQK